MRLDLKFGGDWSIESRGEVILCDLDEMTSDIVTPDGDKTSLRGKAFLIGVDDMRNLDDSIAVTAAALSFHPPLPLSPSPPPPLLPPPSSPTRLSFSFDERCGVGGE